MTILDITCEIKCTELGNEATNRYVMPVYVNVMQIQWLRLYPHDDVMTILDITCEMKCTGSPLTL